MHRVWIARDTSLAYAYAFGWRVTHLRAFWRGAAELDEHRVVNVGTAGAFERFEIGAMSVSGELDAVGKALLQIVHQQHRNIGVAPTHHPIADQLAVGAQTRPCPSIASAFGRGPGRRDVPSLAVAKCPDFIALDAAAAQAAHSFVVERRARAASVDQQLDDRVDAHVGHAGDRPHGRSLAEHEEDLDALGHGQLVHARTGMNLYAKQFDRRSLRVPAPVARKANQVRTRVGEAWASLPSFSCCAPIS